MSDIRGHGGISGCGKSDVDFGVTAARRAFEVGHGCAQSPVERKRILLRRIGLLGRIVSLDPTDQQVSYLKSFDGVEYGPKSRWCSWRTT